MRHLILAFLLVTAPCAYAATLTGRVVGIADGDTLTVLDTSNQQRKVRLYGIDAPEKKQPFGTRSNQSLAALAFGKYAVVEWTKPDRYGRIVGKVIVCGQDVRLRQIEAGLAWWYRKYAREQSSADQITYARAEEVARIARLGLWGDSQALPPWEYRHPSAGVTKAGYRSPTVPVP
jgi:endonuclease YncB( thermonuclease family)